MSAIPDRLDAAIFRTKRGPHRADASEFTHGGGASDTRGGQFGIDGLE